MKSFHVIYSYCTPSAYGCKEATRTKEHFLKDAYKHKPSQEIFQFQAKSHLQYESFLPPERAYNYIWPLDQVPLQVHVGDGAERSSTSAVVPKATVLPSGAMATGELAAVQENSACSVCMSRRNIIQLGPVPNRADENHATIEGEG
ncbi:hypothetical protein IFM46972_00217 [Aspergillus udagawae]|uniref:Uncharacterized protein n=1 Tax=Aspergillus udagawae TaxID=91492 RepID=A0A8H3MZ25_9EURO|nr:hypothetical protein IFM46972_00217 [Aspergillus udagawae]